MNKNEHNKKLTNEELKKYEQTLNKQMSTLQEALQSDEYTPIRNVVNKALGFLSDSVEEYSRLSTDQRKNEIGNLIGVYTEVHRIINSHLKEHKEYNQEGMDIIPIKHDDGTELSTSEQATNDNIRALQEKLQNKQEMLQNDQNDTVSRRIDFALKNLHVSIEAYNDLPKAKRDLAPHNLSLLNVAIKKLNRNIDKYLGNQSAPMLDTAQSAEKNSSGGFTTMYDTSAKAERNPLELSKENVTQKLEKITKDPHKRALETKEAGSKRPRKL